MAAERNSFLRLPKNVRNLGWVSFLNDVSSERVYPLLPLFLAQALGAGVLFAISVAALPASLLLGLIWKSAGVQWAFSFGAMMALIATVLAMILMREAVKKIR
jgi:hypothetical protein